MRRREEIKRSENTEEVGNKWSEVKREEKKRMGGREQMTGRRE